MMTKTQTLELIEMFDGYGLVITDEELLNERADELEFRQSLKELEAREEAKWEGKLTK